VSQTLVAMDGWPAQIGSDRACLCLRCVREGMGVRGAGTSSCSSSRSLAGQEEEEEPVAA